MPMTNEPLDFFNLFAEPEQNLAKPASIKKNVAITKSSSAQPLSKAQKQFNSLLKKIDAQKTLLLNWQATLPRYNQEVANSYTPLHDEYCDLRAELVLLFDSVFNNKLFKKTDKAKLRYVIIDMATELIENGKEELILVHDKYADYSFEESEKEADEMVGQSVKAMMEMALGIKLDDDVDFSSPEELAKLLHQKKQEQEEKQRQAYESRAQRKKTAKQSEREAKKEQEDQTISQSIREAYRKLSSSLHPDREQDPTERERKTELMQRVNAAYAKKDLLKLLELQLEVEQIDPAYINTIAEDRLKYINKVLQGQFSELEQDIQGLTYPLLMQLSIPPYVSFSPEILMSYLKRDIQEMNTSISEIKQDLSDFRELSAVKAWLKSYRIPKANPYDAMEDMMAAFNLRF
jgi:hypothetical protein